MKKCKVPVIMACMLLLSCASSSKPKLTEDTKVNPTVNDFYVKVTEVEEIATRIDSQLRELEIQELQTKVARDIEHIAITDTTRRE